MPYEHLCVEVCDTGLAMPAEVADRLFKSHVSSKSGLGVGLYHAAHQAAQAGYALSLVKNRDGEVRFRLEKTMEESAS
jgi:sensor histidine kinase regulating citrate/malate metabolism